MGGSRLNVDVATTECDASHRPTEEEIGIVAHSKLKGVEWRGAWPRVAGLGGVELRDAEPRGAEARGAEPRGKDAEPRGAEPGGAELRGAELRGAEARGAEWNDSRAADMSTVHCTTSAHPELVYAPCHLVPRKVQWCAATKAP